MRSEFRGPFLGFTFNGVHSSELNIVRINTGNRAEMPLSSSFKDITAENIGGIGNYYFGTQVQQLQFTINFAFDNLTEKEIFAIRKTFCPTAIGKFWFDESPYRQYQVKVSTQPKLSYLVFDEGKGYSARIYKGEGSVAFTAFYSYASTKIHCLEDFVKEDYCNINDINEWGGASRILSRNVYIEKKIDQIDNENGKVVLYNAGDVKTPLKFKLNIKKAIVEENGKEINKLSGNLKLDLCPYDGKKIGNPIQTCIIDLSKITIENEEVYFIFDSNLKLLIKNNLNRESVENHIIIAGDFFILPAYNGEYYLLKWSLNGYGNITLENLEYNYIYF